MPFKQGATRPPFVFKVFEGVQEGVIFSKKYIITLKNNLLDIWTVLYDHKCFCITCYFVNVVGLELSKVFIYLLNRRTLDCTY